MSLRFFFLFSCFNFSFFSQLGVFEIRKYDQGLICIDDFYENGALKEIYKTQDGRYIGSHLLYRRDGSLKEKRVYIEKFKTYYYQYNSNEKCVAKILIDGVKIKGTWLDCSSERHKFKNKQEFDRLRNIDCETLWEDYLKKTEDI